MKIKIDGTEIEILDGVASYDIKAGTISFTGPSKQLLLIEGPKVKSVKPKKPYTRNTKNEPFTKTSVKNKVLKMLAESENGIVTSQAITYSVLGQSSSSGDKTYLKRVMSDLVSEGVLVIEKRNERSIYKLGA
jgi:hypothetical protein